MNTVISILHSIANFTRLLTFSDAAKIVKTSELVMVDLGKTGYLECLVDANPITKEMIEWRRKVSPEHGSESDLDNCSGVCGEKGSDGSEKTKPILQTLESGRVKASLEGNRSFLIIHNITEEDSGGYECRAFNGIGKEDVAPANLVVKRKCSPNRYHT